MLPAIPKEAEPSFLVSDQICQRFSLDQIRSATQNFDEALVIGQGGFGKVYKGLIKDGSDAVVAIKKSNSMSNQGALQFRAEVEMLSKIRHCNLVSLIGYCHEGTEMALVYEYMPEGTLADHLHKPGAPLSWLQLLKICIGAARGLDYLHTGTGTQDGIIHRDVKSSNVLLDKNFAAKISDFGLAKIGPTKKTRTHVSTMVKGTFGYLDPHYVYTGELTRKSDVYSFGVLLLEVICGRPAVDTSLNEDQWGLAPWAQNRIREGKRNHIIDSRLRGQISSNCLKHFVRIASECLHNQPNPRPRMAEIVARLDVILSLQKRLDYSVTEGKFIGRVWSFFQAKVESTTSEGDKVNNAMLTIGKAKVDLGHKDVFILIQTSGSKGEPSDKTGKVTSAPGPQCPSSRTEGNLKSFSYNVLRAATNNFGFDRVMEERGLRSIFKGWIDEPSLTAAKPGTGTVIGVSRIDEPVCQGDHHEWLTKDNYLELIDHPNLVKLIGYCVEDRHSFQVCEFMARGSLENLLSRTDVEPLSWNLRIKIVLGAAKGLAYLHDHEANKICCNIKPDNILVDSDHNGKLSNFWLTEGVATRLDTFDTWKIVNGIYAAPEYVATGCSTARSDIYSFGVVLLEVLTGQSNFDKNRPASGRIQFDYARPYMDSKRRIIDDRIVEQFKPTLAMGFSMIGNRCLSIEPSDRPTADEVVKALEELQALHNAASEGKVTSAPGPQCPSSRTEGNLKSFSYNVLRAATNNFGFDRVMEERGLRSIFKGWIDEPSLTAAKPGTGTVIGVSRIDELVCQGDHHEWLTKDNYLELIDHPNLVKLIGYCVEDRHSFQVCEFMARGSLENLLSRTDVEPLSWNLRIKIVLGAAKGLAYLHDHEANKICCNIKPNNILVDSDHNGKLSNFWLEGVMRDTFDTWNIVNSSYAAPEYVATGCSTARSDIYSFGVVLLEVLTGQRNLDINRPAGRRIQVDYARPYLDSKRRILRIIDHRIVEQFKATLAMGFSMLVNRCLSIEPMERPTADGVVKALEELQALQNPALRTRQAVRKPVASASASSSGTVQKSL